MEEQVNTQDENREELLAGHSYDGIQEFDNPIPGWWSWLFAASIVFAPIYFVWFHSPEVDRSLHASYERAYALNMERKYGEMGDLEGDESTILKYMNDENLAIGENTFKTYCTECHGKEGQGITGPNLTDDYYINVKKIEDIAKVIQDGAKAGAMPAWKAKLHPNAIVLTASYVATLRGQNLDSPRKAEGNEIPAWPAFSPSAEEVKESASEQPDEIGSETDKPAENEAGSAADE